MLQDGMRPTQLIYLSPQEYAAFCVAHGGDGKQRRMKVQDKRTYSRYMFPDGAVILSTTAGTALIPPQQGLLSLLDRREFHQTGVEQYQKEWTEQKQVVEHAITYKNGVTFHQGIV